jgi:ABC-2 type transport system permease protein
MKSGKKKAILCIAVVLCLLLSLAVSVGWFSNDNIRNVAEDRKTLEYGAEEIVMKGWTATAHGYLSVEQDPTVEIVRDSVDAIANLRIDGELSKEMTTVTVFYTDAVGEQFSAEKCFQAPVEAKNDDLYIRIDREVCSLRLLLCREIGCELELKGIALNPRNLNVNFQMLVLVFLLPFSVVLFLVEMIGETDGLKKTIMSLKNYRYLLVNLVSRDIKTKYRRSVLGILWSVLNPLLMMLVLTAVFSNIFRFEIQDFPVYYLTGFVLFNFVSEATSLSMSSVINSAGLIKKVYIPKIIFPLEKCLFSLVNLLFSLIAAVVVFFIVGVQPAWTMLLFFVPILYLFVFAFGFSLILATLNTFFRDVGYLYGVLLTVWMYLTPIIYPMSILPGWMQSIVRINPLYHYVEYFRAVTIYGTLPSLSANLICIAYAIVFLLVGAVVFQRNQNKFVFFI